MSKGELKADDTSENLKRLADTVNVEEAFIRIAGEGVK